MLEQSHTSKQIAPRKMEHVPVRGLVCQECEREISPAAVFCPHCHAAILRRYCPRCGKLVPDSTAFCPYCGTSASEKIKHVRVSSNLLLTICASVSLLTLSLILIYKNSPSSPTVASAPTFPAGGNLAAQAQAKGSGSITAIATVNPVEGSRLNLVGHRLLKEGRYDDAINVLRRAVHSFPENSQDPSYIFAMYNLGHSLRRSGKVNEAIPLLMQCVQMDSRNPMFHEELQAARRAARNPS